VEISPWIRFRASRKRGSLRVSVCARGRSSSTSTEATTAGSSAHHEHALAQVDGLVDVVSDVDDRHEAMLGLGMHA